MKEKFVAYFGHHRPVKKYFSPGRVNLIGEHIDYNGGFVFPAAINLGTYGLVSVNDDDTFRFVSLNFEDQGIITRKLNDLAYKDSDGWANYAKGVIATLHQRGYHIPYGFDLLVDGDLPTASGLSSSASLEVLVAFIANDLYDLNLSRKTLALLAQSVENDYMHMHCGIMDQLVIACGKKDKALLMNTATLDIVYANANFEGYQWIIMNTNYQRKTTESKYNERRKECEDALAIIKKYRDVDYLCDLSIETLEDLKPYITDQILYRRAKHAVTEQARTIAAKQALNQNKPLIFGDLLNQSHASLKDDFEVTGLHLDTLVASALEHHAIGARVTGAGFGGCAIALVRNKDLLSFEQHVGASYEKITGLKASFYLVTFEHGVGGLSHEMLY
ncbi:MAG: galactokinase [Acholeplasmataceae bacterium]